jgi:flagellar assembly factor FliW
MFEQRMLEQNTPEPGLIQQPMAAQMPGEGNRLISPWLGEICWETNCELLFPSGLPGFERHRRLVPVEIPAQRPLIYLQSAAEPEVCFLALPVLAVDPGFELRLSEEDLSALELEPHRLPGGAAPALGIDVICLALLVPAGNTFRTNLDAPIVVNLHNGRGVQAVSPSGLWGSRRLGANGGWENVCWC